MDDAVSDERPLELQAPEIVGRLILAVVAARDLSDFKIEPAMVLRQGSRAVPMVWARHGPTGFDALMSAATARHAAVLTAGSVWALAAFEDPAALGLRLTRAADEAESLAAGTDPKELCLGQSH